MSPASHFLLHQRVVPATANFLINGLIAWWLHGATPQLALWGEHGYSIDLALTAALIPAITWLIVMPMLRKQAAAGRAPDLTGVPRPALARWMPGSLAGGFAASFVIGMVVCGLTTVAALAAIGAPVMSGGEFPWFKAAFSAMVAFVMQPVLVFAALQTPAHNSARG